MLTPIQIQKHTHFFNILDFDNNEVIEVDDFEAIGENLSIIRGFDMGTSKYDTVMRMTLGMWERLAPFIRGDHCTLEEWLTFMSLLFDPKNANAYKNYILQLINTLFHLFDINSDGYISQNEYVDLFIGLRIEVRFAPKSFKKLDAHGAGHLSKQEVVKLIDQFMRSGDANAPGNWLFGGWEK